MFDFRYHALSLAAVFIALVVGLLLGVAIGDKELVSSAQQRPAQTRCAPTCARPTRSATRPRRACASRSSSPTPPTRSSRRTSCAAARIGLVVLGDDDGAPDIDPPARCEPTGADLALVAIVRENVEPRRARRARPRHALRRRRRGRRRCSTTSAGAPASRWCSAAGSSASCARALLQSLSGEFGGLDGVIVMRPPTKPKDKDDRRAAARRCRTASPAASCRPGVKVVGVERRASDPSQHRLVSRPRAVERRQHRRAGRAGRRWSSCSPAPRAPTGAATARRRCCRRSSGRRAERARRGRGAGATVVRPPR